MVDKNEHNKDERRKEVKRKDFLAINRNIKLMKKSLIKLRKKMIQFFLTHSDSAQFSGGNINYIH